MVLRSALAAAAAAALLLGAAGCKPSSLTPFGIGTRGPDTSGNGVNGVWQGATSTGGAVNFQVSDDTVVTLTLIHGEGACVREFPGVDEPAPIEDGVFVYDALDANIRWVLEGRFTSPSDCSGTYRFEIYSTVGGCPTSGAGSFVATKAP